MSSELVETIAARVSALPEEEQREVLDYIESIARRHAGEAGEKKPPFKSVLGIFEHTGTKISAEDIAEMRREMWKNFPRDNP